MSKTCGAKNTNDLKAIWILSTGRTDYLLIALSNGHTYEKFELTNFISLNFSGFKGKLSKYIEHFKKPDR